MRRLLASLARWVRWMLRRAVMAMFGLPSPTRCRLCNARAVRIFMDAHGHLAVPFGLCVRHLDSQPNPGERPRSWG